MPDRPTTTLPFSFGEANGAELVAAAAGLSDEQLGARLDSLFAHKSALEGAIVVLLGEVDRREAYRGEGATATEPWAVERFGVSAPTARALTRVAEKAWDLPELIGSLCAGGVTFDKVRAVADVATTETDGALCAQALEHSVRELAEVARTTAARAADSPPPSTDTRRDRRSLHFNEACRTMTVQLPPESFAETRTSLEARARDIPSDGTTPWDERLCDAFLSLLRSPGSGEPGNSPFLVVAHVSLDALAADTGDPTALAGELERDGLLNVETVRRLACDATVAVAVDDDVGHTMYEGRARRFATRAQRREVMRRDRGCRFPSCTNVTFTNVHHVVEWKPGGRTDLDNLALLCEFHHGLVHRRGWTMEGNANEELTFLGPTGRVMVSRPSPLWTRVSAPRR